MQFDMQSKTTWVMVVSALCGLLAIVGVKVDPDQQSDLVQGAVAIMQAITLIGPVVGAVYHQRSKKNAQLALVNAGVSHEDAKLATKS